VSWEGCVWAAKTDVCLCSVVGEWCLEKEVQDQWGLCVFMVQVPYVMGTKCPYKDGNIRNPCPCRDILVPIMSKKGI